MQQGKDERSLGELFSELSREMSQLAREEVALAKTEMSQKAAKVGKDSAYVAVGGAVLYAGFLVLLAAAVIILALFMSWWLAALVVGVVVTAVGGFLTWYYAKALTEVSPAPKQTIESLKEDKEWMKEQAR